MTQEIKNGPLKDDIRRVELGKNFRPFIDSQLHPSKLKHAFDSDEFELIGIGKGRIRLENLTKGGGGHDLAAHETQLETPIFRFTQDENGGLVTQVQQGPPSLFEVNLQIDISEEQYLDRDWALEATYFVEGKEVFKGSETIDSDDFAFVYQGKSQMWNGLVDFIVTDETLKFLDRFEVIIQKVDRVELEK